ncbi:MAG: DUF5683 domain-containing protein [Bacteroidota bacterium]
MTRIILESLQDYPWLRVVPFLFLIVHCTMLGQAQSRAEIRNVDFSVRNDSLFVTYDLDKAGKDEQFNVLLKISTPSGKIITPYTMSGDVGANVTGGKAKQIIWSISKDNIAIDEDIAVEVIATSQGSNVKFVSRGKAVLLSAVVPGLGLTKLNNGGPYWIMAIAVYGAAAGSYLFYSMAEQNYTKYLDARTEDERNSLHSTVQSQKNMSNVLMYTAGAVWLGNMIWTLANPNKTKPGKKGISFGGSYNPLAKAPVVMIKYKF